MRLRFCGGERDETRRLHAARQARLRLSVRGTQKVTHHRRETGMVPGTVLLGLLADLQRRLKELDRARPRCILCGRRAAYIRDATLARRYRRRHWRDNGSADG